MQSKEAAYERWKSGYNVKQISKTLLFLRDLKIESPEQLIWFATQRATKKDELLAYVQQSERWLAEIASQKKHIINYSKSHPIYE